MIGIDSIIETLRLQFVSKLWTSYPTYSAKGRAFLNVRDGRIVPEVLVSGNEYQEVMLDDTLPAHLFFVVGDVYEVNRNVMNCDVDIYFAVNLKTVYPSVTERAVEYVHRDVIKLLGFSQFNVNKITTGREAFKEFDVAIGDNMQPFYLVKFSTTVENIIIC